MAKDIDRILAIGPMRTPTATSTMLTMNSALAAKRLVLVGPPRGSRGRDQTTVRRYRLARLKLDPAPRTDEGRFDHLKRLYD
ncbi:MAG TPA: hypothetical protein VFR97_11050 [Capillimicrobium sp.]|nr:hypothetical protein [Capillimicrobium sp.]